MSKNIIRRFHTKYLAVLSSSELFSSDELKSRSRSHRNKSLREDYANEAADVISSSSALGYWQCPGVKSAGALSAGTKYRKVLGVNAAIRRFHTKYFSQE